ncbi:MAG: hypothetical protein Q9169_004791 [Polycauliona sp. 2 TL-2023]
MLCYLCQTITPAVHHGHAHSCLTRHHACFQDLIKSAEDGCELCRIFLPSVEKAKELEYSGKDGKESYKCTNEDPFRGPYPDRKYVLMGDETDKFGAKAYYVDFGTHLQISGMNIRDKEADLIHKIEEELENDGVQRKDRWGYPYKPWYHNEPGLQIGWRQNHYFDDNETLQWLFFTGGLIPTGPEQIWIDRRSRGGNSSVGPGPRESISYLELTAGSINLQYYCSGTYCCEDISINEARQLAISMPGLWGLPRRDLGSYEFFNCSDTRSVPEDIFTKPILSHSD